MSYKDSKNPINPNAMRVGTSAVEAAYAVVVLYSTETSVTVRNPHVLVF